jgi:LysM repeat protein
MRHLLLASLLLFSLALPIQAAAAPDPAPDLSAGEVFALVNDYRAANGLPSFTQNSILMQTAQGQSDYQASIQQVTHGGPGGSRPRDRAYAAGYGGGQIIFISELITGGFDQTPDGAMTWWKNSPEHNSYLLSPNYVELGIGVASDANGRKYYTAVMGHIAGGTTYVPEDTGGGLSAGPAATAAPVMIPVIKEEPRANGALVHIVRTGQALWTIAAVYQVPLEQLYELNNLNAFSYIFPEDEIIIDPPGTYAVEPEENEGSDIEGTETTVETMPGAAESTPTLSLTPTRGDSVASIGTAQPPSVAQNAPLSPAAEERAANSTVFLVVGVALFSIIGVFVASFFIQGPRAPEPEDNDPFGPLP